MLIKDDLCEKKSTVSNLFHVICNHNLYTCCGTYIFWCLTDKQITVCCWFNTSHIKPLESTAYSKASMHDISDKGVPLAVTYFLLCPIDLLSVSWKYCLYLVKLYCPGKWKGKNNIMKSKGMLSLPNSSSCF